MKGIAVFSDSIQLVDLPEPGVEDILDEPGLLVETLHVDLNGTNAETNAAEYGEALRGTASWSSATSRSGACWTQGAFCDGC